MFRKKRSRNLIYIVFFVVLIFSINRFFLPFSDLLKYSYSVILHPVFLSQEYLIDPIKKIFAERKSRQELEKLVFKLNRMLDNLIAENINLRSTASYYDQIKEVLEFKRKYETENLHFCKILFKHINKNSHFVYIDKGFANGIENDMVAVYNNFLLGKVVETYKFYSKVLLVTDKSCKVSAYCESSRANGISEGINLLDQISLNRISHLEQVQVDDIVLSSGHGLVFPQGFALGKIVAVQKGELYNTVKVQPMFNIKNINYCYLLKKGEYNINALQVASDGASELDGLLEKEQVVQAAPNVKTEPAVSVEPAVKAKPAAKNEPVKQVKNVEPEDLEASVGSVVAVGPSENTDTSLD